MGRSSSKRKKSSPPKGFHLEESDFEAISPSRSAGSSRPEEPLIEFYGLIPAYKIELIRKHSPKDLRIFQKAAGKGEPYLRGFLNYLSEESRFEQAQEESNSLKTVRANSKSDLEEVDTTIDDLTMLISTSPSSFLSSAGRRAIKVSQKGTILMVNSCKIDVGLDRIMYPEVPIALRMSIHLIPGVVRIYSKKVDFLYQDCNLVLVTLKNAFVHTDVNLPPNATQAQFNAVTLPETYQLDALDIDDVWSSDA